MTTVGEMSKWYDEIRGEIAAGSVGSGYYSTYVGQDDAEAIMGELKPILNAMVAAALQESANRYLAVAAELARGAGHDDPEVLADRMTSAARHIRALVEIDRGSRCPECGYGTTDGRLACGPNCGLGS